MIRNQTPVGRMGFKDFDWTVLFLNQWETCILTNKGKTAGHPPSWGNTRDARGSWGISSVKTHSPLFFFSFSVFLSLSGSEAL